MSNDYLQEVLKDTKKWLREVPADEFIKDFENFQSESEDRVAQIDNKYLNSLLLHKRGEQDEETTSME